MNPLMEMRFTPRVHRICLSMGLVLAVLYAPAFVWLADFWPPPNPDWSAAELSAWLVGHGSSYRAGCIVMIVAAGLLAPWGAALSMWTLKTEARFPVLFVTQIVLLAVSTLIFIGVALFWAVASFRAGQTSPEVTQALFDIGWFMFLFDVAPVIIWTIVLALGMLWNPPEHQLYPRWGGYFTLALAACWTISEMLVFYKSGPYSYTGILGMWIPLATFFIWLMVMSLLGLRAIKRQEELCRAETTPGFGLYRPCWDDDLSVVDPRPLGQGVSR